MLNENQKKRIEFEYEDYALMGEHGICNGMEYVLRIIDESEFADFLNNKYR